MKQWTIMLCARRLLLRSGLAVFLSVLARSDEGSRWRIYGTADGLAGAFIVSVTISPRGNVWVKQNNSGQANWLDGFQVHAIPDSANSFFPVYESRSSQIWSLYTDGVMEFRRDQWLHYPLGDVRVENGSSLSRLIRPIPLLPAERDHVLILLPDRLLEFDAGQNQTIVLRSVKDTRLGRFNDLVEARDGGAWLCGSNGLARLPGPVRRLTAQTKWEEFLFDPGWGIQNIERPLEDADGEISVPADSSSNTARVILHFNGHAWESPLSAPDKARFAWRGADETLWAVSRSALWRWKGNDWKVIAVPGLIDAQFFDVATEGNGVFWLATSAGLVRHAPQTWRPPKHLSEPTSPALALSEDRAGTLWVAEESALVNLRDGREKVFDWPPGVAMSAESSTSLFTLPDGGIVVGSNGSDLLFDPKTETFSSIVAPVGRRIKAFVGRFGDGRLCAQLTEKDPAEHFELDAFDGSNFERFFDPSPKWPLGDEVFFMHVTEGEHLWLGTAAGLAEWDAKMKSFVEIKGFTGGRAECLLELPGGKIWCAGGGLVSEFNGKTWTVVRYGLGHVNAMLKARDESVWVATSSGLYRFMDGSWVGNGVEEGLPAVDVLQVRQTHNGEIWAGTGKGLSSYHRTTDLDPPASFIPTADNPKDVSSSDVVKLVFRGRDKWDETTPERLLFAHRMDDGVWSPFSSETSATFTNLAAGKHRFAVRAMDRNWNEETEPEVYEFASIVPWFKDPRLLSLAVFGCGITIFLAWLAFNRHLRLMRSYAEVERIVAQRTEELERANQELLHSQKMRALGTLAAGIAHDFNSILSIIKGSAQIIETNLEDRAKVKTRVDRINTMVEQGAGIVKAMLGFSRAGQDEKLCDVNQLVSETRKILGDQFARDLNLQLELVPVLPQVMAIGELIQQMLLNLALNAADAMGWRGRIVLSTGVLDRLPSSLVLHPKDATRYVIISVKDDGCGIAPDVMSRIFEPFFTTKSFSARRGTGLGLSMVYEIAKEMGFGLMVGSVPGQGSVFTIILPAESALPPAKSQA